MSVYVMSDIHGCYQEFQEMLSKIGFSPADRLILAGDCIDRGKDTYKMLRWIENCPENVVLLRGNHEEEFAQTVDFMLEFDQKQDLCSDFTSNGDAVSLYQTVRYFFQKENLPSLYFDVYGTIHRLLRENGAALKDLIRWARRMREATGGYQRFLFQPGKVLSVCQGRKSGTWREKPRDSHRRTHPHCGPLGICLQPGQSFPPLRRGQGLHVL